MREYDLSGAAADYPPRQGPPQRTLILCTQQRSGSTLLGEAITFAGGLGCPLEYFHSGFRPALQARWQAGDFDAYVAALHRHRTDPSGTLSVKLFWRDIVDLVREIEPGLIGGRPLPSPAQTPSDLYRGLHAFLLRYLPQPSWLFLTRRDSARQAISNYIAWQTGSWRQFKERAAPEPVYDFDAILQLLTRILRSDAHWRNFFRANGIDPPHAEYEDLQEDYDGTARRILAAAGRAGAPVAAPRLHKQGDDAHADALLKRFMADFRAQAKR